MEGFASDNDRLIQQAEVEVLRAMKLLDNDLAREYFQAMETVPELVTKETPVLDFLRREDFHPYKAAVRLARNWKQRKNIFGDRWLLPMTLSGRGALRWESVELLKSGYMFLAQDGRSSPVLLMDYSRLIPGITYYQPEVFWYLMTVGSSKELQTEGVNVFHQITAGNRELVLPRAVDMKKVLDALPIRAKKFVIARAHEVGKEQLLDYRAFEQSKTSSAHCPDKQVSIIEYGSVKNTRRLIEEQGIPNSCLTFRFGGNLDFDRHLHDWIRARVSLEESSRLVPRPLLQGSSSPSCSSIERKADSSLLVIQRPTESKEEFERRRNVVYRKRFVVKEKRKHYQREEDLKKLFTRNTQLKEENRRLEQALAQARMIASMLESYSGGRGAYPTGELQQCSAYVENRRSGSDDILWDGDLSEMI